MSMEDCRDCGELGKEFENVVDVRRCKKIVTGAYICVGIEKCVGAEDCDSVERL